MRVLWSPRRRQASYGTATRVNHNYDSIENDTIPLKRYREQCWSSTTATDDDGYHRGGELTTRPTIAEQLITTEVEGEPCQHCQHDLFCCEAAPTIVSPILLCCC